MATNNSYETGESSRSHSSGSFTYNVFVNFRGTDVRTGFVDHLCRRLKAERVTVFIDNLDMNYGEEIMPMLYEAIENSQLHVVTFSPQYGDSKWCLKELVKIVSCKSSSRGHTVLPVFYKVEPRDVRHAVKFMSPKTLSQEDIRTVSSYKSALGEIGNLKGFSLEEANWYEGQLVDNVVQEVINILRPRELFVKEPIIGRDSIVQDINMWLQDGSENVDAGMIYGAGGMGKTTISQIVFNKNLPYFTGACYVAYYQSETSENRGLIRILEQIISDVSKKPLTNISNVPSGLKQVQDILGRTKTLLVLDDVDDLTEVESMFKHPSFFHSGSKIIITTRNKDIGKVFRHVKEFSVDKLNDIQSNKLFNCNAFRSAEPPQEYMAMSKKFIQYCDGLPLALCTLASSLYDEHIEFWEYMLDTLAKGPNAKVHSILRVSFDSIKEKDTKELFLDIAHYFVGVKKDEAFPILDALTPYLDILFSKLVARCLVTVDVYGRLMMHQLIQEMAREVVRQEANRVPGSYSRLSNFKETLEVMQGKKGTETVRCLSLRLSRYLSDFLFHEVILSTDGFKKMENLKFLHLYNAKLTGSYSDMPKKIKCLKWEFCQLKSIPTELKLNELIVLHMKHSKLVRVWESTRDIMVLNVLKVLDLNNSLRLKELPNLSGCPSLERIILENCPSLVNIHESIRQLTKLSYLNVNFCRSLRRIPCFTSVSVDAFECEELVEIGDNIKFEFRRNMNSGWTKYMGCSELESLEVFSPTNVRSPTKVEYQYGIFSAFLYEDHIAKWFTLTTEGPKLNYVLPFRTARRIRALNICCVYDSYVDMDVPQLEVQVHNDGSVCKWLFNPILYLASSCKTTWLTHWPITQHRELNAGDTLKVTFFGNARWNMGKELIRCGIKVLYDEEFEEEVSHHEESVEECADDIQSLNKGPSRAYIEGWYEAIFRNSDHATEAALGVHRFRGLRPTIPKSTHPKLTELLHRCWLKDPASRPDFTEIIHILETTDKEVHQEERKEKSSGGFLSSVLKRNNTTLKESGHSHEIKPVQSNIIVADFSSII